MKQFSEPRNVPVRFPNTKSYAVDPARLKEVFGNRYVMLDESAQTQEVLTMTDFTDVPKNMQRYLPQGHPFFQQFRQQRRFTGSTAGEYLGFHDMKAATILDLPEMMRVSAPENRLFDELRMYTKYGMIPRATLDQPGPCWAMNGTDHEENVNATLLGMIPSMIMYEVGTIVITNEQLEFFGVYDVFDPDKKPLRDLEIEIAISPDYSCYAPETIVEGEDGKKLYGEMIMMAGENKVPTVFMPQPHDKTEFPNADFFFVAGRNPWEKPKEYYVPQFMLEMFALMCRSNIVTAWTCSKGARSWKINMDVEYLSMIITIFNYLYVEFVKKDLPVPTNYFMDLPADDHRHKIYMLMLQKTKDICKNAEVYMFTPKEDTLRITSEVGVISKQTYVEFPVLPDFLPDYHRLLIYGRRLFDNFTKIKWPLNWTSIHDRMSNVSLLSNTQLTSFSMVAVVDIMKTHCAKYHADIVEKPVVKQAGVEKTETYMVALYKLIFDLYGSPIFSDSLDEKGFYRNIIVCAYVAYEHSSQHMNRLMTLDEIEKGRTAMFDTVMENFSFDNHHEVFTQHWIDLVIAHCRQLVASVFDADAPDACFKASKLAVHIDILADNSNFHHNMSDVTESRDRPNVWQYQRLLAVLMAFAAIDKNISIKLSGK